MNPDHISDPNGKPNPVTDRSNSAWLGAVGLVGLQVLQTSGLLVVASGVTFFAVCASMGPLQGSTRSARIQWQQRQQEIQKAIAEQDHKQVMAKSEKNSE